MIDQSSVFSQALQLFFQEWRGVTHHISLADGLEQFFADFKVAPTTQETDIVEKHALSADSIDQVLNALREPIANARARGEFMNIWTIAGLRRDELRHASVLRWLIDCGGSHGQCHRFLQHFLRRLATDLPPDFPSATCLLGGYSTRVESNPFGDTANRIDIEIESDSFLIFIEAKIDAMERPDQLHRYLKLAERKAAGKPFCVVFLSPAGQRATIEGGICHATWRDVADSINEVVQTTTYLESGLFLTELLKQLGNHLWTL
jgi:hypothetical protein